MSGDAGNLGHHHARGSTAGHLGSGTSSRSFNRQDRSPLAPAGRCLGRRRWRGQTGRLLAPAPSTRPCRGLSNRRQGKRYAAIRPGHARRIASGYGCRLAASCGPRLAQPTGQLPGAKRHFGRSCRGRALGRRWLGLGAANHSSGSRSIQTARRGAAGLGRTRGRQFRCNHTRRQCRSARLRTPQVRRLAGSQPGTRRGARGARTACRCFGQLGQMSHRRQGSAGCGRGIYPLGQAGCRLGQGSGGWLQCPRGEICSRSSATARGSNFAADRWLG